MKLKYWLTPTTLIVILLSLSLALLGGFFLWLSHQSSFQGEPVIGKVISIQGQSEIRQSGSPFWSPLSVGYEVRSKDKVKTHSDGLVAIQFHNNDVIKILPNSSVTLTDPTQKQFFKIEIGNFQVEKAQSKSVPIDTEKINTELANQKKLKQKIQLVQENKIIEHEVESKKSKEWSSQPKIVLNPPEIISPISFSRWNLLDPQIEKKITWSGDYEKYKLKIQWENQLKFFDLTTNHWTLENDLVNEFKDGTFPVSVQVRGLGSNTSESPWSQPVLLNLYKNSSLSFSLSHLSVKMTCKKEQWICENPIKLQLLKKYDKKMFELIWSSKDTNEKFIATLESHPNSPHLICPPQPNPKWELQIREQKTTQAESQQSAIAEIKTQLVTPPDLEKNESRAIDPTLLLVHSPNCRGTLVEFSGQSKKSQETFRITSHDSFEVLPVTTPDEWTLQTRYINKMKTPLSDWSYPYTIKPFSIDLTGLERKTGTPLTQWNLKDSGNIYLISKNTKPWSSLQWSSNPQWPEYEVQIFSDEKLENELIKQKQKTRAFTLKIPENTYQIFWRVRGIKGDLVSSWSDTQKIEIKKLGVQANDGANKVK